MSKRRKRIILFACGILALATLWQFGRDREPSYRGRTLSEWAELAGPASLWKDSDEEVQAVRAIGTNALPTILKWISYQPSPSRKKMAALMEHLPSGLTSDSVSFAEERAGCAVTVFHILGPQARVAIPELSRLALTAPDEIRASRCMIALTHLGPEALPSALALITNGPPHTRYWAMLTLYEFGTNAAAAVPVLVECLNNPDNYIAGAAADTLAGFGSLRSVVVRSLTNAMPSLSNSARVRTVEIILRIKAPASETVPALHRLLSDPKLEVRDEATSALLQIAPEVLSNTPAR
jgi:hypothetical protein